MTKDSCYGPRRRVGYTVRFTATARRDLHKLPPRVLLAVIEFAFGDLAREPRRGGKPLRRELTGLYSARRGPYRLLYRIASRTRRFESCRGHYLTSVDAISCNIHATGVFGWRPAARAGLHLIGSYRDADVAIEVFNTATGASVAARTGVPSS